MKFAKWSFFRGMCVMALVHAAIQDFYGLDAYIEVIKARWTHFPTWWWIVWGIAAFIILAYQKAGESTEDCLT